jgi:glycosidase
MPKLNYGCQDVKRYVFATLKRWLKPVVEGVEYEGIDGWRLDHAIGVPMTFWKSAHDFTKKLNKNSLFLAELIEPDTTIKPYLDNGAFDCVMNYGFYFLACEFFTGGGSKMSAKEFDTKIWNQLKLYPLAANYLAMNLLGTHDTERIASLIVNRRLKKYGAIEKFFENTHASDRGYTTRRPDDDERRIQRMMIAFEFAMIGSPMVYYGDELGMYGANDPDCRKPMCWQGMDFQDEHVVVGGRHFYDRREPIAADMDMLEFYRRIIALRRNSAALMRGTLATDYASTKSRVWVISRRSGDERVIFAFNCEDAPAKARIIGLPGRAFADYFGGDIVKADEKGAIGIQLPPKSFRILRSSNT